jgi:hypothetical protein
MTIYRIFKSDNYSALSNEMLRDFTISHKARGILCYLLSKPHDWKVRTRDIETGKDKDTSVRNGLTELREAGYIKLVQIRDSKGRVAEWEYHVFEVKTPDVENPDLDNRYLTKEREELKSSLCLPLQKDKEKPKKEYVRKSFDYPPGFAKWWNAYPTDRARSKRDCYKVWKAEALEERTEELVEKLERLKLTDWNTTDRRYIKTSLPYLNGGRYDDDIVPLENVNGNILDNPRTRMNVEGGRRALARMHEKWELEDREQKRLN